MAGTPYAPTTKPYLSVINGKFAMAAQEGDEGTVKREYETKDGAKAFKYEQYFTDWTGTIVSLKIRESEFGDSLHVELEDAILTFHTESRFFSDFAKKICSATQKDLEQPLTFKPFDFEGTNAKGEPTKIRGINIFLSADEKLTNAFYDGEHTLGGFPEVAKGKKYDKDDWKIHFTLVKKFLMEKVKEVQIPEKNKTLAHKTTTKEPDRADDTDYAKKEVTHESVEIDDLPF